MLFTVRGSVGVALVLLLTGLAWGAADETVYLVKDGASEYRIVVAPAASPSGHWAAEELQAHIEACTGVTLPIVEAAPADGAPMIVLGCGPAAQGLGVDPSAEVLGEQGYVVRTVTPHLVIAGTAAAGTLYGVYDFLERRMGVRWYAPGVTKTPAVTDVPLPEEDRVERPAFAWRHTSYTWPGRDAAFMARVGSNSGEGGADHPQGIQYAFDGRAHSYFRFVSPGEFFDSHPEYFSEIGGVRRKDETQLCLTNPDVLEIVTERMLKRMGEYPHYRQHNFSQMDWYSYCECVRCSAMNARYGTMGGTQFWFVNQLAERTSKRYPDKLIGTLAYIYTEQPPKGMAMHPNVAVWLCHMFPSCDSHPIETCPLNADYKRRALDWAASCSHVYIWHYIVDFAHYYNPFPNFRAMAGDMAFYRDIGVEGIYLQAMGHRGGGGEFSLLRPYYGMKLLWDPGQDAEALMRDFLYGYYGAAAGPIWAYIQLVHDKVEQEDIHMHLYTNPAQGYLADDVMARADVLFDEAERAVKDDEVLLERVRVARMPLTYARLFPRNGYRLEADALMFEGSFAPLSEVEEFLSRMERHGFQTIREWAGDPQQLLMFGHILPAPIPLARIENTHLTVEVVPFLGGRALRIVDRASGACVTAYNTTRNLFFPYCGGEESRMGGTFAQHEGGGMVQFAVTDRSATSIALEAEVRGFTLRRTLALAPDAPVLTVTAEVTNRSDQPREAVVRSHLELDLGDLRRTRVQFVSRAGEEVAKGLDGIIAGLREGERYTDQKAPNGAWTFTGSKGLTVRQTFEEEQADFTWLYAYPETLGELEVEVWAKPVTVAPGARVTFRHAIEVRPATQGP